MIFKEILLWIWENIFNIALVLVGCAAFVTYIWENHRKMKTAATVVLNQIDEIEEAVKLLKTSKTLNDVVVYKSKQIISKNYWHKYKHLLLRKLKPNQIHKIDKIYSQAEDIEKSRLFICNELLATVNNKNLVYQLNVASEIINMGGFDSQKSAMKKYYDCGATFSSGAPREYFDDLLRTYEKLSDTPDGIEAYKKLKKISYSRRL